VSEEALESARKEAATAVQQGALSQAEITAIGQAVAAAMAAVLAQQADASVSKRVAERVSTEGLRVIAAGA
jgi:hypothetical protein